MYETFSSLDIKIQAAIISACTTLLVLVLNWIWKIFYEHYSLRQKLNIEYVFEQQKSIKEEIAKSKTPLLLAAESLNYRLWNLESHKSNNWLLRTPDEWIKKEHHYIRSFVYKWVTLIYWILKAEKSIGRYDGTLSPKEDLIYLKYVKTIKFSLCDRLLIENLEYTSTDIDNHFYIDDLEKFANYIESNGEVISFYEFEEKIKKDIKPLENVFKFFSKTEDKSHNKSTNMLQSLHLIILGFLNTFGHEYQQTDKNKIKSLLENEYSKIAIKKEFKLFLSRHKIDKDMKSITKYL